MSSVCPACGVENPWWSEICECGYDFNAQHNAPQLTRVPSPPPALPSVSVPPINWEESGLPSLSVPPPAPLPPLAVQLAPQTPRRWWMYDIGILLVLSLVPLWLGWNAWSSSATVGPALQRATYLVNGSASSASLTYRNESGGTEQRTVPLPWTLEMHVGPGHFLYVSAQKQGPYGAIRAAIYVEGQVLQEAESSSEYGIASASGSVPR